MNQKRFTPILFFLSLTFFSLAQKFNNSILDEKVIFGEKDGLIAIEAEFFWQQTKTEFRQWYRTSKKESPLVGRDEDKKHCAGASYNAYIEILPDTRVTAKDKLIAGENFSNEPGKMAVLHYKVNFNKPGRYYVWARIYSSGAEDNGLHVGFDGNWPEHGQRMQWCDGKNQWTWASQQRTQAVHCGVPKEIYLDIDKAGIHDIQFSMREDGFEFDKFLLTNDINFIPEGEGPAMRVSTGKFPKPFPKVEAKLKVVR